jgi:dienelactone hydrolase
MDVHEREIGIATADGDMVTFVVHPDGDGPWPVAVLFMDGGVGYCRGAKAALHAAGALPDTFVAAAGIHPSALVTNAPNSPHHDVATVRGEPYVAFAEIDRSAERHFERTLDLWRRNLAVERLGA